MLNLKDPFKNVPLHVIIIQIAKDFRIIFGNKFVFQRLHFHSQIWMKSLLMFYLVPEIFANLGSICLDTIHWIQQLQIVLLCTLLINRLATFISTEEIFFFACHFSTFWSLHEKTITNIFSRNSGNSSCLFVCLFVEDFNLLKNAVCASNIQRQWNKLWCCWDGSGWILESWAKYRP